MGKSEPLHTFGDCMQYGFNVTDAPQLVIMKFEIYAHTKEKDGSPKGRWVKCGLESAFQEEIGRNGGVDATIAMMFAIKRSQTPGKKPYRTSTQQMEDEKRKLIAVENMKRGKTKKKAERNLAKEEAKNDEIREANAKRMRDNELKMKVRAERSQKKIQKEAEEALAKEEKDAKKKANK